MENSDIQVKDIRIYGFIVLYDMHTEYFRRAIEGITDGAAQSRLDTKANHISWLAGSLVQQRYEFSGYFGNVMQQTSYELFSENKGIKDHFEYPPLLDFLNDWEKITPVLRDRLINLEPSKLDEVVEMGEFKLSYFEWLSFNIYREANVIGQIALWRRLLGYPALKYD